MRGSGRVLGASTFSVPPTYTGFSATSPPPASWRPYSISSVWNREAARAAALHPKSAEYIAKLIAKENGGKPGNMTLGESTTGHEEYKHPFYWPKNSDPKFKIKQKGGFPVITDEVPLPAGAAPATGSDHHLGIVTVDGVEYDMWDVTSTSGGILLCENASKSRIDDSGLTGFATAAEFSLMAGMIRIPEWKAACEGPKGTGINHALFMVIHECTPLTTEFGFGVTKAPGSGNSAYVFPASHGASIGANEPKTLPCGAWLRLNYTDKEIEELNLEHKWEEAIVLTLARFGCYIGDTGGGHGPGFQSEAGISYTSLGVPDPSVAFAAAQGMFFNAEPAWESYAAIFTGGGTGAGSKKVDWSRWQVLQPPTP